MPGRYDLRGVIGLVYIGMKQAGIDPKEIERVQRHIIDAAQTYYSNDSAAFFAPPDMDDQGNGFS